MLLLEQSILFIVIGLIIGVGSALVMTWIRKRQQQVDQQAAHNTAARIIDEAKKDANAIKKEAEIHARDSVQQERIEFDKEVRETRRELQALEKRLVAKDEGLEKRIDSLEKRENDLGRREASLKGREKLLEDKSADYDRQIEAARKQLEQVAGLTHEEARKDRKSVV